MYTYTGSFVVCPLVCLIKIWKSSDGEKGRPAIGGVTIGDNTTNSIT